MRPPLPSTVPLSDGTEVTREAMQFGWKLRDLGIDFEMDGDRLAVSPRSKLTDAMRAHIREHWHGLAAIARLAAGLPKHTRSSKFLISGAYDA